MPIDPDFDDPFDRDPQVSLLDRASASWERPAVRWFVGLLIFGVLAAVVMAMRAAPTQTAAVPVVKSSGLPPAQSSPAGSPTASLRPSPTQPAYVVVDVTGPVRSPGLFTLPAGSRIADAVAAAGGLKKGRTQLNLARVLQDGEQIDLGATEAVPAPSSAAASANQVSGKLNLNTATSAQLEELPRVGPVLAAKIIEFRDQHSGFRTVDQLREVSGIGEATFAQLAPLVTAP